MPTRPCTWPTPLADRPPRRPRAHRRRPARASTPPNATGPTPATPSSPSPAGWPPATPACSRPPAATAPSGSPPAASSSPPTPRSPTGSTSKASTASPRTTDVADPLDRRVALADGRHPQARGPQVRAHQGGPPRRVRPAARRVRQAHHARAAQRHDVLADVPLRAARRRARPTRPRSTSTSRPAGCCSSTPRTTNRAGRRSTPRR